MTAWLLPLVWLAVSVPAQPLSSNFLSQISYEQNLHTTLSLDAAFRDESGQSVRLSQYFGGKKPVILVLGYYECPMLCSLVLNGFVESLQDLKWSAGREFNIVTVSIDPRETPALATAKKKTYVKRYGRSGAAEGWSFLTGDEPAIRKIAAEAGFRYVYDPASKQYAHASGIVVLTPEGKIARYFFGITYPAKDLRLALSEASANKVGSPIERLLLLCFHYNPITGKYGPVIMTSLRVAGVATVVAVGLVVAGMIRRERIPKPIRQAT